MMQEAAAVKDRTVVHTAEPSAAPRAGVLPPAPEAPGGSTRRRSTRPLYEERFRRATFFLTPGQLDAIGETAYRLGIGKSEFVRRAISEELDRNGG